ncbi:hypothetical protein MOO45_02740 [Bombilactobacillus folatiphilus]|uniref:Uncharacterized protein n=1 Tax=Bombilactobacillus folatiphilus TaxID=2923362 RepID=A0ABY4PAE7_9LACO|nr:hypothetical protein [Bombilactobacillus folatiphilus]UQS82582.1 hypothetical protein MOO45_02740 [Bombilactobacillus folatiphilus]
MHYLDVMIIILEIVKDNPNIQFQELLYKSQEYLEVQKIIKSGQDNQVLIRQFLDLSENLIDEGFINGQFIATKDKPVALFNHLTSLGYLFLEKNQKPDFKTKVKTILKEQGISTNFKDITRAIAQLFL